MLPSQLTPESFHNYPPQARTLAVKQIDLLQKTPLAFLPLLLREVISYDWKFPAEQQELEGQFRFLRSLSSTLFDAEMRPFSQLQLNTELQAIDWVNFPARFSEQLSAHLWATHQIEAFREASVAYVHRVNLANPPRPLHLPRLTMVVLGQGVTINSYKLFRKIRPHGTYFTNVDPTDGRSILLEKLTARAEAAQQPFSHWYLEGASLTATVIPRVVQVSYRALDNARINLVNKMRQTMQPGGGGPEALRTMMAQMSPQDIGLGGTESDEVLNRFQVSLLTEGSGTQLFSTTFVQWAAREILRRAQPLTLLSCYAPRQREQSMQELLSGTLHQTVLDPQGSLVDADMGAYYTWINQQRLPGADQAGFLVWFDGHREAMAVGPHFAQAKSEATPTTLKALVDRIA